MVKCFIDDTLKLRYDAMQKLIEWHFDIFGLIDKELAIDINKHNIKAG